MYSLPEKIIALDFEMFNTKHYWSVCWTGMVFSCETLDVGEIYSEVNDPAIKERFIGPDITFPFNYKQLAKKPRFYEFADKIFSALDGALVIGHAIENDVRMIASLCKKYDLKSPSFDFVDTNVCYCAIHDLSASVGLKTIADTYGVEFSPHDPSEDARATLLSLKAMCDGNLPEFLLKHKIHVGRFENGLMRKCYGEYLSSKAREKIENFNAVFDACKEVGFGNDIHAVRYAFSAQLMGEQNLAEVAKAIISVGDVIAFDGYCADILITNDLGFYKSEPLIETVKRLKLDGTKYTYKPKKVIDAKGNRISAIEYLNNRFKANINGKLYGKQFCFSRSIENGYGYFDAFKLVRSLGGEIVPKGTDKSTLIVPVLRNLKSGKKHKKRNVISLVELNELNQN